MTQKHPNVQPQGNAEDPTEEAIDHAIQHILETSGAGDAAGQLFRTLSSVGDNREGRGIVNAPLRLFVDDLREPPDGDWIVARTATEAIALLEANRFGECSLDHDLGNDQDGTGYTIACWFEEKAVNNEWHMIPDAIAIHSANPVGCANIRAALQSVQRLRDKSGPTKRFRPS